MHKSKITKGEKWLLGVTVCGVTLALGAGLWRHTVDANSVITIPKPAMPVPNAYDFYIKAGQMHVTLVRTTPGAAAVDSVTDATPHEGMTPQQLAKIYPTSAKEAWVKTNAPVLRLLHQGFTYQARSPWSRSPASGFPFYAQSRELARFLMIASHARSERGDWAGASRYALDILHLGHDIPRGDGLLGGLVGSAINAIGRKSLTDSLPHLDAAASRAAATQIEKLEATRVSFAEIMQEAKWSELIFLQQMMQKPGWRASFLSSTLAPNDPIDWNARIRLELCSKRRIIDNYTHSIDAFIIEARKPYTLRQEVPTPDDPVTEGELPSLTRAAWSMARDETGNTRLAVQFALRAFKLERGVYPQSLSELVPSYLKKIPLDAYGGGQTLRYRKTGNTYLLYSIGPDGKDDGGKPIDIGGKAPRRYLLQPDSKGDYVAGINR